MFYETRVRGKTCNKHFHLSDILQLHAVMCFQAKGFTVMQLIFSLSSTLSFFLHETHADSKKQDKYAQLWITFPALRCRLLDSLCRLPAHLIARV